MSESHTIKASPRRRSGSSALKQMRREGLIPAVIYGAGVESVNLKVDSRTFTHLLHHSAGENLLVNLDIEGESSSRLALIQDVQHHPLTGSILHADFHQVKSDEVIHTQVPLELIGTPAGVKSGGVLEHQIHSVEVRCLPGDLPATIRVDVSELTMGDAIHASDISLPEGVKLDLEDSVVIAIVTEPKVTGAGIEEGEEVAEAGEAAEAEPGEVEASEQSVESEQGKEERSSD